MKRLMAATASAAIALTGTALMASPAEAAAPVVTGGLINVTAVDVVDVRDINVLNNSNILTDFANDNQVNVGVGVAAQLCGDLNVAAILAAIDDGPVTCNSGDFVLTQAN